MVKRLLAAEEIKKLPLPERFIVSKAHMLIEKVTTDLESYRFGEAGRHIYDFLWDDLADWYIETSKSHVKHQDVEIRKSSLKVLVYVWDMCLRVLHPYMPYITETLWQNIPHEGETLMLAPWPTLYSQQCLFIDHDAIRDFVKFKKVIGAVRNARAEYNVDPGKKIAAVVKAPQSFTSQIQTELQSFLMLARVDEQNLQLVTPEVLESSYKVDKDPFVHLIVDEDIEVLLPQSGLIDKVKEQKRLNKQKDKLTKDIFTLESRLSNEAYVDKAPAHIIKDAQEKLRDLKQQAAAVEQSLELLLSQ